MPRLAASLVAYMKGVFGAGHTSPAAHNILFEAATRMRDDSMARMVARPLFGDAVSAELAPKKETTEVSPSGSEKTAPSSETLALGHPDARLQPLADERSITTLITHLNATSQTDVLVKLVYRLIPYLSYDSESHARTTLAPPPTPNALPLSLYPVLLSGLRKGGKTGLAQRVFSLAQMAEEELVKSASARYGGLGNVDVPRLSIDTYTEMINVYANEVRASRPGKEWVKGWRHKDGDGVHRRDVAASNMAWRTYNIARNRWRHATNSMDHARCAPNLAFFVAINRACARRWQLKEPGALDRRLLGELQVVSKDMTEFGFPLSPTVSEKLDMKPTDYLHQAGLYRDDSDPAVSLAEKWLRSEVDRPDKRFTPM